MTFSGLEIVLIPLALGVLMVAAWRISIWIGRRLLDRPETRPSKFDDGSMALLGLLLAFSFGMSIAKHDQRRFAVVADSNAIGDFYTCASLLKEPARTNLQNAIREYAELRVAVVKRTSDLESALVKFDRLHLRMTEIVAQALNDGTPIAVSLTNTLNGVTSNQASRLAAYRDRLPTSIVVLFFVSALLTTLLIGREQGASDTSDIAGTLCFIFLVVITVYVILDLNQPESGWIRVSQEPIQRLLSSIPQ